MHRTLITISWFVLAGLVIVPEAFSAPTTTQLPRTVRPTHYDVTIVPDAASLTFKGKVVIAIEVLQATTSITLNAADLSFSKVVLSKGAARYPAPLVRMNPDEQSATFIFDKIIARGRYRLALDYTGKIGTQASGMFALDYLGATGPKRALYTQFENSDARRVIPSWDEPAFRTPFALEAIVPSGEMAVSNMPIAKRSDLGNGLTRVRFAQTPKMSTYLLFFGLGEFDRASLQAEGTELGVITKKGATSQAAFVLESSKAILREYNEYFAVRYPLPKLDNVAAPGSSRFFSAMENWGAIFTFEEAILLDPSISTQSDKQRAFSIAAHEMAHQWFGNLVTMRWWDDIWLNEGFASWIEARTTRRLHPEWNTALAAVRERERAMGLDALKTTHPVVQHVDTVEQASQAFDDITYQKGEAVISMLEGYVGAAAWRDGVRRYIKAHAYGNTVTDDLWREIEKVSGQPITVIAHEFTLQPGVPMIRVDSAVCDAGTTTLRLTQTEFSKDQPDKTPLAWRVPVMVQTIGGAAPVRALVSGGQATVSVPGCAPVIVNPGQSGYYRTVYAPGHFRTIAGNFGALAPIDQLGLLSDTWSLGLAGLQPVSDFLDLAKATSIDADPQIWGKIAGVFEAINAYYQGDDTRKPVFQKFAIARLTPVFARIGWTPRPDELDTVAILRNELIGVLGVLGDTASIDEARRRYAAQATDPTAVSPLVRKAILGVVALHADAATWDQLHAAALAEKTAMVKEQLYELLASTQDEGLARRALDLALTQEPGETNSAGMLSHVARLHPDLAFDFALAHIAVVNQKVDGSSRSRYFPRLASESADPAMIAKLKAYAAEHLAAGSRRDAETAMANIAYRIKVRNERLPVIDAWLAGGKG
ncbi:MAG: M1 family metallopeptidase [Proteobacteria bacterium]|nr:M1 family metallopeptidase [Pseudomonadota bacterium]